MKRGPALVAINGCPKSSNETTSASPDGVSCRVVTLVTLQLGKVGRVELGRLHGLSVKPQVGRDLVNIDSFLVHLA